MKDFFRKKTWIILAGITMAAIIFSAVLFFYDLSLTTKITRAGAGDNVQGWAWNDNIGWISFNCTNTDSCAANDYGVNIEPDGNFTGYAWSDAVGYIWFNASDTPPAGYSPIYSAKIDLASREVSGWARICSMADDYPSACTGANPEGWIKMRCYGVGECSVSDYGVYLEQDNYFRGWAWNEEIGWISFSSRNCDTNGNGVIDPIEAEIIGCPSEGTPIESYGVDSQEFEATSGYWKFDGDYTDSSFNNNTGIPSGGVDIIEDEIMGQVASFDGVDGYVAIPGFSGLTTRTVSFWFRPGSGVWQGNNDNVIFGDGSDWQGFDVVNDGDGTASLRYHNSNGNNPEGLKITGLLVNKWHFATFVQTATEWKLYSNGVYVGSNASIFTLDSPVTIGSRTDFTYPFHGLVDDVKIYNYVLDDEEIRADFDSKPRLVGKWKFNEGAGILTDDEVNNNDGALINGPTWKYEIDCVSDDCLEFDGENSYVDFGSFSGNIISDPTDKSISWGTWVNPNDHTDNGYIISSGAQTSSRGIYMLIMPDEKIQCGIKELSSQANVISGKIFTDKFTYVMCTFDQDTGKISVYINGVLNNSAYESSASFTDDYTDLTVGTPNNAKGTQGVFSGFIDEVEIYNYAFLPDEVEDSYDSGLGEMASSGNVTNWAWSENFGWFSFSQEDCGKDEYKLCRDTSTKRAINYSCAGAGSDCTSNGGECVYWCLVCEYDSSIICDDTSDCSAVGGSCVDNNYNVDIDITTGFFSGYAWSSNVGWIDFAPDPPYPSDPQQIVKYEYGETDYNKRSVTGWAKILTLGDEGWLKMSDDSVGIWNGKGVKIDITTSDFSGWAWNGADVDSDNIADIGVGWMSFNCADDEVGGCAGHDYKVVGNVNTAPEVTGDAMANPGNCDYACACGILGALNPQLLWTFYDPDEPEDPYQPQTAYQIFFDSADHLIEDLDAINDGSGNLLPLKTPKLDGLATSFYPSNNIYRNVALEYNQGYYWWVKVWDKYNMSSEWVQFYDPDDLDNDGNSKTFTTYLHEFPDVEFTWVPKSISLEEEVKFIATTNTYFAEDPTAPVACSDENNDSNCIWAWSYNPPENIEIIDGTFASSTMIVKFKAEENKEAILRVTDEDSYYCENTYMLEARLRLPRWKEIKAE
ncbi:MAG: LamG domain-containing protein [Patescibacteria group bacterium]